jgi:methyltransferase-like protein/ubiquinone/menaquinone biosynthesis C-methylase UbiE
MSATVTNDTNAYDLVPYKDFPYPFTHPRLLEAMAVVFGMEPPDITRCRVLELGCAGGGNLIPQAEDLPGSTFLGIDLSQRQIDRGQQVIAKLGLSNIELRQADILDISPAWGQFDYILCHGVFSWVPPPVQEKILEVVHDNLSPQGVAVVSYNTYPGWHLSNVVRDVMRFHTAQFSDPRQKVEQAIAILRFLADLSPDGQLMRPLLAEQVRMLEQLKNDSYVFHEFLETNNCPLHFHEFISRAMAHGLQYLAEPELSLMLVQNLPPQAQEVLRDRPLVEQEQYMDFLRGRKFRKTLLCHAGVPLNRGLKPDLMKRLHFGLNQPLECTAVDIRNEERAEFRLGGAKLWAAGRVSKAAMIYLNEIYPRCVSFRELHAVAMARVRTATAGRGVPQSPEVELANTLLSGCTAEFFTLSVHPPACVSGLSQRPLVRPLARLQAQQGGQLASQRHQPVGLNPVAKRIVQRLDGRHDVGSLVSYVQQSVREGKLEVKPQDGQIADADPKLLRKMVTDSLAQISASGLLVG